MIINKQEIRGRGFFANCLKASSRNMDIAKAVVEQYCDNPRVVIDVLGLENTIKCHEYYLNQHYNLITIAYNEIRSTKTPEPGSIQSL